MPFKLDQAEHVKDQKKSGTVVPWHTDTRSAPDEQEKCTGTLTMTQEAYADVTRCNSCNYYAYWGIGD